MTRSLASLLVVAFVAAAPAAEPFQVKVTGTGRPMLFVPGLACSGEVWDGAVAKFSPTHQCHVFTLAGFAGVPTFEGPYLDTVVAGLAKYVADRKLDRPVVVGHSIGGFIAFRLASEHPTIVGPVVSVDGLPFFAAAVNPAATEATAKSQAESMKAQIAAAPRAAFLAQQRATFAGWITDEKKLARVAAWAEGCDQATVGRALADLWGRDLREQVAKITVPVLAVGAPAPLPGMTREELVKRYDGQYAKIPRKTVAYAATARHFVMYDEPEWLWKQMEAFLAANR